ncbi:MAG: VOC family protein [Gemmatimonadales bacterium]
MPDTPRGHFIWYECLTKDKEAAVDYYTKLIGWGTTDWESDMGPYTMWTKDETPIGGVMVLPEEAMAGVPPFWLGYISTPDTDATTDQTTELGGAILVPPMTIPTIGRMAVLKDPQGAIFACYTPETPALPPGPPEPGSFSWHELITTDWGAGLEFYSALFGWEKKDAMDMGEMGTYQMYGLPGSDAPLGGMYNMPPETPVPNWLLYAMVESVDAAAERMNSGLGGTVLRGPMEVPGGSRVVQCQDPQGAAFAMHSEG